MNAASNSGHSHKVGKQNKPRIKPSSQKRNTRGNNYSRYITEARSENVREQGAWLHSLIINRSRNTGSSNFNLLRQHLYARLISEKKDLQQILVIRAVRRAYKHFKLIVESFETYAKKGARCCERHANHLMMSSTATDSITRTNRADSSGNTQEERLNRRLQRAGSRERG